MTEQEITDIVYDALGYAPDDAVTTMNKDKHDFWISIAVEEIMKLYEGK